MASAVCQDLQSCLEPGLVEPRVLIQNLAPQKSNLSQPIPWPQKPNVSQPQHQPNESIPSKKIILTSHNYYSFLDSKHLQNKKEGGDSFWSSITSKDCKEQAPEEEEEAAAAAAQLYVHPLVKRFSSTLSTKSLEMCTESLGTETGSSIGESIHDFPSPLPERSNLEGIQRSMPREFPKKRIYRSASFPPPLTSISGSESVWMRPHREGGRLVLKAVSVASCSPYFQTERSNGRLRLSLLKGTTTTTGPEADEFNGFQKNAEQIGQQLVCQTASDDNERSCSSSEDDELEEVNDENVGYEVGVGEFPKPSSRCKEGGVRNKRISNWEPFLVAI